MPRDHGAVPFPNAPLNDVLARAVEEGAQEVIFHEGRRHNNRWNFNSMAGSKLAEERRMIRRGSGASARADVQLWGGLIGREFGRDAIKVVNARVGEVGKTGVKGPEGAVVVDGRARQNRRKWGRFQAIRPSRHCQETWAEHGAKVTQMGFSVRFRFLRRVHGGQAYVISHRPLQRP
jgi:hypothetical protein